MEESPSPIHVVISTDDGYAVPTYIALYSLLHNHRGGSQVKAYVLVSVDLMGRNAALLESLSTAFPKVTVRVVEMGDSYASVRINNGRITTPSLYKLMIPRLLGRMEPGVERCVYLDSDLVVERDIDELYGADMNGCLVAGVRDRLVLRDVSDGFRRSMGVPTLDTYVNTGVLLMDVRGLIESGTATRLEAAGYRSDLRYNDQDVVNSVCYGAIKLLPCKFNASGSYIYNRGARVRETYGLSNVREVRMYPVVVHYYADIKP